jgi:ribosomal protein S18 acetylase RimI-like enzyme
MDPIIRPARPQDAEYLAPLVYSSGPAAFDYVFKHNTRVDAIAFLTRALQTPGGEFGYDCHWTVELGGEVVGAGAGFTGEKPAAFMISALRRILGTYGLFTGAGVIFRGLRMESMVRPPKGAEYCVAHLGIRPDLRGNGLGERLIRHLLDRARSENRPVAVLDVSVENPRAQALYERLGFIVTAERPSRLVNATARVPDHRRMELRL